MLLRRSSMALGLAFVLVLCLGSAALAADLQLYPGARAMGMAGAFVAVADDGTGAYWNPAGISQLKIVGITPSIAASGDWTKLQTSLGNEFPPNLGNTELAINGMLGALFRGFGISALFEADARTYYEQSGGITTSEGGVQVLGTGLVTLARRFGDVFALGVNLKGFYGRGLSFEATKNESNPLASGGYYTESLGTGYGLDLGALFKVSDILRVGAKVENLFAGINWDDTKYTYDVPNDKWVEGSTVRRKEDLSSVLHLGLAVKPPITGTLIATQIDMPLGSKGGGATYHIGVEQSLLLVKLRAGAILDSGFSAANYTAGLGFKLGPVGLDVAAVADSNFNLDAAVLTAGFTF